MRKSLILLASSLVLIAAVRAYYYLVYIPQRVIERVKPLIDAGLTMEEAMEFDRLYQGWAPYNESEVEFAQYWARHPKLAAKVAGEGGLMGREAVRAVRAVAHVGEVLTKDQACELVEKWYPGYSPGVERRGLMW